MKDLLEPLITLAETLGFSDELQTGEYLEHLTCDLNLNREVATSITLTQLQELVAVYGNALERCRFLLGDLTVLSVDRNITNETVNEFQDTIKDSPTVIFEFRLDKRALIENYLDGIPTFWHPFLYFFPERFLSLLTGNSPDPSSNEIQRTNPIERLKTLERKLWQDKSGTGDKVVIFIPNGEDIQLRGSYLSILSGSHVSNWQEVADERRPDTQNVTEMYQICRQNLKWEMAWLEHLTPLHLSFNNNQPIIGPFINALHIHLINLILLYTADQTISRENQTIAIYRGAQQNTEIRLQNSLEKSLEGSELAGVEHLLSVLRWTYHQTWEIDRLPFVQIAVVQTLRTVPPEIRYSLLLHSAQNIQQELDWHWRAFIERKVDGYISQVRELEDYVVQTTQAFADQITSLINKLTDAMLAAVAAVTGSFIVAALSEDFNPIAFRLVMGLYGIYLLVFPLVINMTYQCQCYRSLVENFTERRKHFEERLHPDQVEKIVRSQINDSQEKFTKWFNITIVVYLIVLVLVVVAIIYVPVLVTGTSVTHVPTPTALPVTVTSTP